MSEIWKKCSVCKKSIPFSATYYLCSVSTCRGKRTGLTFCSPACWDGHLAFARHRESYAEEMTAPSEETFSEQTESENSMEEARPKRRIIVDQKPTAPTSAPVMAKRAVPTLIVVTKVKALVKEETGFNTSQCAIDALTQKVVQECFRGVERAKAAERKTLMGRDIV